MSADRPCLHCPRPRSGTRLDCGSPECMARTKALPYEEINAIRQREVIEGMRQAPADGRGWYIHMMPRD